MENETQTIVPPSPTPSVPTVSPTDQKTKKTTSSSELAWLVSVVLTIAGFITTVVIFYQGGHYSNPQDVGGWGGLGYLLVGFIFAFITLIFFIITVILTITRMIVERKKINQTFATTTTVSSPMKAGIITLIVLIALLMFVLWFFR